MENEKIPESSPKKTNKSALIGGILVAIIAIAVYLIVSNKNSDIAVKSNNQSVQQKEMAPQASLKELLAMNKPQKCEFDMVLDEKTQSSSKGTIYISNGKLKGDFISYNAGKSASAHYIMDDEYTYFWEDESSQGFKVKLAGSETVSQQQNAQQMDLDKKLDYKCSNWSENVSIFSLPDNIKFTDYSEMMNSIDSQKNSETNVSAPSQTNLKSTQCSACESAPDADSKAQCKAALACD